MAPFFKFKSLPNNKILDWSKLKAFADDKINVTKELKFVLGKEKNILGKGENAGNQHFLLFPQCLSQRSYKSELCWKGLILIKTCTCTCIHFNIFVLTHYLILCPAILSFISHSLFQNIVGNGEHTSTYKPALSPFSLEIRF